MFNHFKDILKPDVDELSANSSKKLWLLQGMIDAIDNIKELLEKRIDKRIIYANGESKPVLSLRKIYIIRLIHASLKLNYHPLNISISLSGIFNILYDMLIVFPHHDVLGNLFLTIFGACLDSYYEPFNHSVCHN